MPLTALHSIPPETPLVPPLASANGALPFAPPPLAQSETGQERRVGTLALAYWDACRRADLAESGAESGAGSANGSGGAVLPLTVAPSLRRLDLSHPLLSPYLYLLSAEEPLEWAVIRYSGASLAGLAGKSVLDCPLSTLFPRERTTQWLGFLKAAARQNRPLADSGTLERLDGSLALYRDVMMPVIGPEGERLLLGAVNYRSL